MTERLRILLFLLPALAVCLPAPAHGPSEEDEEALRLRKAEAARPDVLRLADSLDRDEDEIEKQAHAIAETHDLPSLMRLLGPRDKGGVGVGDKPGAVGSDSVELKLQALAKKSPTPKELEDHRDEWVRMAKVILAVGRAAPLCASRYTRPKTEARHDWQLASEEIVDSAQDLIDALNREDTDPVSWKAWGFGTCCIDCHDCRSSYHKP